MVGPYVPPLCSALAMAISLYLKGAILRAKGERIAIALLLLVIGAAALPFYRAFSPGISIVWTAFGLIVFVLVRMILRRSISRQIWTALDLLSAASLVAAAIYSIARVVLFPNELSRYLSLLAILAILAACVHILHEFDRAAVLQRPTGLVFAETLLIAGLIPWCLGISHVTPVSYASLAIGIVIATLRLKQYFRSTEERRVLEKMSVEGDRLQPEYTEASLECPEPRLWSMFDPMTAEKEVLDLLYAMVRTVKPRLAVETGTFSGISSTYIARAMQENGRGRLITCEFDPVVHQNACERFRAEGLTSIIDCRLGSSLELSVSEEIDLLYCDSALEIRGAEVRRFLKDVNPFGIILMHDAGSRFRLVREAALQMEQEGLISVVLVSTPRGLVVAQKREGRK